MSTIKITSTTNKLAVKLSLDLQEYCEAYIKHAAKPENKDLSTKFMQLRTLVGNDLTGIGGALHWPAIKALWAKSAQERSLDFLSENYTGPVPLVIDTLDRFFIELLKNSIDAILKNYLGNQQTKTQLEMSIELDLEDADAISVIIKDNGGGFPASYIRNFPAYITNHGYQKRSISGADNSNTFTSSKENKAYFFGGAGKGLAIILNLLLTGHLLEGPDQLTALYDVTENTTAVSVENCTRGDTVVGAQLKFTSPKASFAPSLAPEKPNNEQAAQGLTTLVLPLSRLKISESPAPSVTEPTQDLVANVNQPTVQERTALVSPKRLTISDSLSVTFLAPPPVTKKKKLTLVLPDNPTVSLSEAEAPQIIQAS